MWPSQNIRTLTTPVEIHHHRWPCIYIYSVRTFLEVDYILKVENKNQCTTIIEWFIHTKLNLPLSDTVSFTNYVDKIFGLFWPPTCWKWSGNSFTVEICIPLTFPDCKFQFFYLLFVNVVCERSLRELQYIRSDIIWPFLTYIPLILMSYVTLVVIFMWPLIGVRKY